MRWMSLHLQPKLIHWNNKLCYFGVLEPIPERLIDRLAIPLPGSIIQINMLAFTAAAQEEPGKAEARRRQQSS
jgi:hypothetical protein